VAKGRRLEAEEGRKKAEKERGKAKAGTWRGKRRRGGCRKVVAEARARLEQDEEDGGGSRWTLFASNANSRRKKSRPTSNATKGPPESTLTDGQRWPMAANSALGESTGVWLFHIFLVYYTDYICIILLGEPEAGTRHRSEGRGSQTHATDYPRTLVSSL